MPGPAPEGRLPEREACGGSGGEEWRSSVLMAPGQLLKVAPPGAVRQWNHSCPYRPPLGRGQWVKTGFQPPLLPPRHWPRVGTVTRPRSGHPAAPAPERTQEYLSPLPPRRGLWPLACGQHPSDKHRPRHTPSRRCTQCTHRCVFTRTCTPTHLCVHTHWNAQRHAQMFTWPHRHAHSQTNTGIHTHLKMSPQAHPKGKAFTLQLRSHSQAHTFS